MLVFDQRLSELINNQVFIICWWNSFWIWI